MKLEQGQLWKNGDSYYRIVKWARLSIDYLKLDSIDSERGERIAAPKKEFCRLLKGATLITPEMLEEDNPESSEEDSSNPDDMPPTV